MPMATQKVARRSHPYAIVYSNNRRKFYGLEVNMINIILCQAATADITVKTELFRGL